jgi:hypothetical protein
VAGEAQLNATGEAQPAGARLPAVVDFECRAPGQHYSLGAMGWFMELVLSAPCSQRAAATIVSWIGQLWPGRQEAPSANAGRSWLFRLGLYQLQCSKEAADDWVWLVDHTVQLGAQKGLLIVGLRLSTWQSDPRPLTHEDVQLLHLEPMEHSDGRAVQQELEKATQATGIPRAIVSDGGSDLKKGIALYQEAHPATDHVYDITHKVALLLKKELEADPDWERFIGESTLARRGLALTPEAFLVPPGLKAKARYMNVDSLVEWGVKTLRFLDHPPAVPGPPLDRQRIRARLGWLRRYRRRLAQWSALLKVAQAAEHYVRCHGWHPAAVEELRTCLAPLATSVPSRRLKKQLLQFAQQQAVLVRPGERLVGSTEVLESLIGKYKRLQAQHSGHGMTRTILALGALVGTRCTQTLRTAFQQITNRDVHTWCQQHLGLTLQARRHHAFALEQNRTPFHSKCQPSF